MLIRGPFWELPPERNKRPFLLNAGVDLTIAFNIELGGEGVEAFSHSPESRAFTYLEAVGILLLLFWLLTS